MLEHVTVKATPLCPASHVERREFPSSNTKNTVLFTVCFYTAIAKSTDHILLCQKISGSIEKCEVTCDGA